MTQSEQNKTVSAQLWVFVQQTYALPGVAKHCLKLQDVYGMDVSLLLYVVWCAAEGRALTVEQITALDEYCEAWRSSVIKPLRAQRRQWRSVEGPWYESAKSLELEAERLMLSELVAHHQMGNTPVHGGDVLSTNLEALAAFANDAVDADASDLPNALVTLKGLLDQAQSVAKNPPD